MRYVLVWGSLRLINFSKPGYASITCSKIENIPNNLIFTTKFNDSSILITINSWDYLNFSVANEYVRKSQYQPRLSCINEGCSSQSDCSIQN
jgi:hypothetical protein